MNQDMAEGVALGLIPLWFVLLYRLARTLIDERRQARETDLWPTFVERRVAALGRVHARMLALLAEQTEPAIDGPRQRAERGGGIAIIDLEPSAKEEPVT